MQKCDKTATRGSHQSRTLVMEVNKKMRLKACEDSKTATDAVMREQRVLAFYAELRGGKATWWVNLLEVNEDFQDKRNVENHLLVILREYQFFGAIKR